MLSTKRTDKNELKSQLVTLIPNTPTCIITLWSPKICDFTYLKVPKNTLLLIIRVSVNVNTIFCGHFAQYLLVIIWVSELKIWLIEGLIRPFILDKTTRNVLISILCVNFADFDSLKYQVLILFDFFQFHHDFFASLDMTQWLPWPSLA